MSGTWFPVDSYCLTCHAWVSYDNTPSGRHEHLSRVTPGWGHEPKPGSHQAQVLDAMRSGPVLDTYNLGPMAWWSTWDLVPYCQSVHVRDYINDLRNLGWTIDERWVDTEKKKRSHKEWRLVLPKQTQGGLF